MLLEAGSVSAVPMGLSLVVSSFLHSFDVVYGNGLYEHRVGV